MNLLSGKVVFYQHIVIELSIFIRVSSPKAHSQDLYRHKKIKSYLVLQAHFIDYNEPNCFNKKSPLCLNMKQIH